MPSIHLVKGFVERHLRRGISAEEAREIVDFVAGDRAGSGELTGTQSEQLARVKELYGDFFTDAGKAAFDALVGGYETRRFRQGDTRGQAGDTSPVRTRIDVMTSRAEIDARFEVRPTRGGGRAVTVKALDLDELLAREGTGVERSSLSHAEARALDLKDTQELAGCEWPEGRACAYVLEQLAHLERTKGDNDGKLAPRDLKGAPPDVARVMELVYAQTGERLMKLESIAERLPAAVFEAACGGKSRTNRDRPEMRALYTLVAEDALDRMARAYRDEVIAGALAGAPVSQTTWLERNSLNKETDKARLLEAILPRVDPPTFDEVRASYAAALDGQLGVRDFYNAAQIDKLDLFLLQAAQPDAFPRPRGLKESAALGAPKRSTLDADEVSALWRAQVTSGAKTIEDFGRDNDIKLSVLRRMRKAHPAKFPLPAATDGDARLDRFVAALERAMDADPFAKVKGLLDLVNQDPAFRAREAEVSYAEYYAFRRSAKERFGRVDSSDRWMAPVAETLREVMNRSPDLSRKELVAELQKTWPQMSYSRVSHMLEADPTLPVPGRYNRKSADELDAIADLLLGYLKADPGLKGRELKKRLKADGYDLKTAEINGIIRQHRADLFTGVSRVQERRDVNIRAGLASRKLLQLCIQTAPPGAPVVEITRAYNKLLEARGLPPMSESDSPRLTDFSNRFGMPGPSERGAKLGAELLVEYARAAPKGASEDEIRAAVTRDYPEINGREWGRWGGLWKRQPELRQALVDAGMWSRGGAKLVGRGEKIPERYRGGWDLAKVVAGAPPEERAALAKLTEYLHIPMKLPLIDAVIDKLGGKVPLKSANLLWVSHLLSDVVPMAHALKEAGLVSSRGFVVGSPYGSNGAVRESLEDLGLDVRVPALSVADYRAQVEAALDEVVKLHEKNDEPILVLDDGGLVTDLLHSEDKYKKIRGRVRVVEQTTGGILLAEKHALETPVGNVARSRSKQTEGAAIGEVVAAKLVQSLARAGGDAGVKGQEVTLIGYGFIGPHIARELEARGAKVTILERNPERVKAAKAAGFAAVYDDGKAAGAKRRGSLLGKADIVVGATGRRSLPLEILEGLKDGARVASASSKRNEAAIDALEKTATRRELPRENPLTTLPNAEYTLKSGKKLVVVGDGWPVNFDGGVQSVPPAKIQLTDAAMLAMLLQIASSSAKGLVDLDPTTDAELIARFEALAPELARLRVYDPDDWERDLVALADIGAS